MSIEATVPKDDSGLGAIAATLQNWGSPKPESKRTPKSRTLFGRRNAIDPNEISLEKRYHLKYALTLRLDQLQPRPLWERRNALHPNGSTLAEMFRLSKKKTLIAGSDQRGHIVPWDCREIALPDTAHSNISTTSGSGSGMSFLGSEGPCIRETKSGTPSSDGSIQPNKQ